MSIHPYHTVVSQPSVIPCQIRLMQAVNKYSSQVLLGSKIEMGGRPQLLNTSYFQKLPL